MASSSARSPAWPNGGWPISCTSASASVRSPFKPERSGDGAGNLRHFDGVGKTAPVVVRIAMRKYLRLPRKPAKGPRMNDAGAVALEGPSDRRAAARYVDERQEAPRDRCRPRMRRAAEQAGMLWVTGSHAAGGTVNAGDGGQCLPSVVGADSRASLTFAFSSFFCTLLTSLSSTSAGTVRAYCASDWSHCATARRRRPVFSYSSPR